MKRSLQLAFISILIGCGLPARAQDIQYDPPATTTNTLTLITGPIDSTAIQIGADIASLLNNKLRIFPVVGRGAIQNVADLLSFQQADLVITRTDTLDYLDRKGFADKRQLAYIAKLYNEEMMVVAPNSIHSLKDLEGKHVGIDLPGEGTFVTAQTVFNQYDIHSTFDYAARQIALEKLKQGTLDAVIILASKPYDPVQNFDSDHRFHLVPVPYDNSFGTHYLPTSLTATDCLNLISNDDGRVDTITVPTILISSNPSTSSDHYKKLAAFVDAFFDRFQTLQQPPYLPKWRDVSLSAPLADWHRLTAAQQWLDNHKQNSHLTLHDTPQLTGLRPPATPTTPSVHRSQPHHQ